MSQKLQAQHPLSFFFFSIQYKGRGKAPAAGHSKRIGSNSCPRTTRFKRRKCVFISSTSYLRGVKATALFVTNASGNQPWKSFQIDFAKWAASVFSLNSILKPIILKIRKSVFIETWKYSFKLRWKWFIHQKIISAIDNTTNALNNSIRKNKRRKITIDI